MRMPNPTAMDADKSVARPGERSFVMVTGPWAAFVDGFAPYTRIFGLLPVVSRLLTAGLIVTILLGASLPVAMVVVTSDLVGMVPAVVASGLNAASAPMAVQRLLEVGALFIGLQAVTTARDALAASLGRRLDEHMRERVMLAVSRPVGIEHLEDPEIHDEIERAKGVAGTGRTAGDTVGPLANTATNWLRSSASTVLLAQFSAPLALGWFCVCVAASHYLRSEFLRSTKVAQNQARFVRRANYIRDLVLEPRAGKEIRVWDAVGWLTKRFTAEWMAVMQPVWRERLVGIPVQGAATLGLQSAGFVVSAAIGLSAAHASLDLKSLALYLGAASGVLALNDWGTDALAIAYGGATVPAVLQLEQRISRVERRETFAGIALPESMPEAGIRFEGVVFRYPGKDEPTLAGLDLFIPAGRSLAIVGANGAGKTTLVKLLARLYDPTDGRITVDNVDLRDIDASRWQRNVSAVFQDFIQFPLTARDNIVFGAVERAGDERALVEAAKRAGVLEIIEGLPRRWDTMLSRQYEGGMDISVGQWQRLALARALFAVGSRNVAPVRTGSLHATLAVTGARILIMDEPTANLDVRAEAAMYDKFLDITQGLTTVVISHRFSTVRRADRIVVLADGHVLEEGTHEELMVRGGRYAEMFIVQASRFTDEHPGDGVRA